MASEKERKPICLTDEDILVESNNYLLCEFFTMTNSFHIVYINLIDLRYTFYGCLCLDKYQKRFHRKHVVMSLREYSQK